MFNPKIVTKYGLDPKSGIRKKPVSEAFFYSYNYILTFSLGDNFNLLMYGTGNFWWLRNNIFCVLKIFLTVIEASKNRSQINNQLGMGRRGLGVAEGLRRAGDGIDGGGWEG